MNLNEKLCTLLEPKPTDTPDFEVAFTRYLNGCPITSTGGFWQCLTHYDEGDVPTWYPIPVDKEWGAAGKAVDEMEKRGYVIEICTSGACVDCIPCKTVDIWRPDDDWQVTGSSTESIPEAVAKAVTAALGRKQ